MMMYRFFNEDLFISVLNNKISNTFNETNRRLFQAMKSIIINDPDNSMERIFSGYISF